MALAHGAVPGSGMDAFGGTGDATCMQRRLLAAGRLLLHVLTVMMSLMPRTP